MLIVEVRDGPQRAPAAHAVNARTFEIWRQIGLDVDRIRSHAQDPADAGAVHWVTKLGGELIGSLPYERQGNEALAVTPTPLRNLSQHRLEPLLVDALDAWAYGFNMGIAGNRQPAMVAESCRRSAAVMARSVCQVDGSSHATAPRARCGTCSGSKPRDRTAFRAL